MGILPKVAISRINRLASYQEKFNAMLKGSFLNKEEQGYVGSILNRQFDKFLRGIEALV